METNLGSSDSQPALRSKRLRRVAISIFLLSGLLFVAAAWAVGGALVAPANRVVGSPPDPLQSATIVSESGMETAAWFSDVEGSAATILLLHPIRADRRAMLGRAKLFHERGYSTLLIDLQAHGESPGDAITVGYRERMNVLAAIEWIKKRNPDRKIGVVGWSLGGAAALLSESQEIDVLALELVYPTISEAVNNRIGKRLGPLKHALTPILLAQLQPRIGVSAAELRPIDRIAEMTCPVLVACGEHDVHTTLSESKRLFEAAPEPKQFVVFEGAAHQDLLRYNPKKYADTVVAFFEQNLGG